MCKRNDRIIAEIVTEDESTDKDTIKKIVEEINVKLPFYSKIMDIELRENEFTKNMNGKIIRQGRVCGLSERRLRVAGRYAGGRSSEIEDAIAAEAFLTGKKGRCVKILIYGAGVVGAFPLEKGGGNEVL